MGADNRLLLSDRLYKKHQAINMLRLCGVRRTCCANKQSVSEDIRASQYNILRHANTRLYRIQSYLSMCVCRVCLWFGTASRMTTLAENPLYFQ